MTIVGRTLVGNPESCYEMPRPKPTSISPEVSFGRVLRELRMSRDMSQEALAHRTGYHRTYVGQLERGEKSPSLRTVFDLAAALSVRPSTMIAAVERTPRH